MKVLQINAVYGQGSTGTIVRDIEQLCEKSGIECYVASPDSKVYEAKRGHLIGNTLDHKIHAIFSRVHGKQAYFSHCPTRKLLRWIDKIKPNIVHLHNLHSNYIHLNMLLEHLAKRDIKTIVTLHDCWFYTGGCFHYTAVGCRKWLTDCKNCPKQKEDTPAFFEKKSAQILADRKKYLLAIPHLYITGVSEWMAHEALKTFLKDTPNYVIHNGIDMTVFRPVDSDFRTRLGLDGKYVILGPASKWLLSVNKEILIRFTQQMHDDEILLLFGVCSESQLAYLNSLNLLGNKVITYGYTKNREELLQLYSMADCFANPTREESMSLINVEAQACGTPVVTFDNTGTAETVDGLTSFKVLTTNVDAMYSVITRIKNMQLMPNNQTLRNKFGLNENYNKYINLYTSI